MTRNDHKMAKLKGCIFYIKSEYRFWTKIPKTAIVVLFGTYFNFLGEKKEML